jgi:hypothetical protein
MSDQLEFSPHEHEPSGARTLPGPQQLRQQERHEQKLKDISEQVAQGKLVIRQMTAAERERYPPPTGADAPRRGARKHR